MKTQTGKKGQVKGIRELVTTLEVAGILFILNIKIEYKLKDLDEVQSLLLSNPDYDFGYK